MTEYDPLAPPDFSTLPEAEEPESFDPSPSLAPPDFSTIDQPTAEPPDDEGGSLLDNVVATWGYGSGELAEGVGMLLDEWVGWREGADFARNLGESAKAYWEKSIPEEDWQGVREEASKSFLELKEGGDWYNPADWERGEAGLESLLYMATQSGPATLATMPVAGLGGKAAMAGIRGLKGFKKLESVAQAGKLAAAAKATPKTKALVDAGKRAEKIITNIQRGVVGTIYGAGEGAIAAGMTGKSIKEENAAMEFSDMLLNSEFARDTFEAAIQEGMSQDEAEAYTRESIDDMSISEGMRRTFATTAAFGGIGGAVMSTALVRTPFAKAFAKGKLRGGAKGVVTEAIQEGIQSPFEQYWQNIARQKYADEDIRASEGLFEAAITGVVVGGVMGGPFGLSGNKTMANAKIAEDKEKNEKDTMKIESHYRQAAIDLQKKHGKTPEETLALLSPILERHANGEQGFVATAADIDFLADNGRPRERGLDNVQTEEVPEFGDLDATIEFEAGEARGDVDELQHAYGKFNGTIGADSMNIDLIHGGTGPRIYIAEQVDKDGKFKQHKVLYGFGSEEEAMQAFYSMYGKVKDGLYEQPTDYDSMGSMDEVTHDELRAFLERTTKEYEAEGAIAVDEPLSETDDVQNRSDEDLAAGIADLQAREQTPESQNRLKVLMKEQERRGQIPETEEAAAPEYEETGEEVSREDAVEKAKEHMAKSKGVINRTVEAIYEALKNNGFPNAAEIFWSEANRIQDEAIAERQGKDVPRETSKLDQAKAKAREMAGKPETTEDDEGKPPPGAAPIPLSLREGGETATGTYPPRIYPSKAQGAAEGAVDVDFLHLSRKADLQSLSGKKAGTSGTRSTRRGAVGKGRTKNRVYVYAQEENRMYGGRSTTGNEVGRVGPPSSPNVYSGTAENMYDVDNDPLGLLQGAAMLNEDMEQKILDAGYSGWYHEKFPGVRGGMGVILDRDVAAMYHGLSKDVKQLLKEPSMYQNLVTWETVPGQASNLYAAAQQLSTEEQAAFNLNQLLGVIVEKNLRKDMLAEAIGASSRLLVQRVGGYEGKVMPSMQVGLDSDLQADAYSAVIKLVYEQDAAPWMHAMEGGSMFGVVLTPESTPSQAQLESFQRNLEAAIDGGAGFTLMPDGRVVVGNYGGMNNSAFAEAVDIAADGSFRGTMAEFNFEGQYRGEDQETTKQLLKDWADQLGRPDLHQWANTAKARAAQNAKRFFEALPESHPARQAYENRLTPRTPPLFSLALAAAPEETFYSALVRTVEKADGMPKKGAVAIKQWLDGQQKKGNLKKEERDWMGLDDFLKTNPQITRAEVQDFVRANQVKMTEIVHSETDTESEYYDASEQLEEYGLYGSEIGEMDDEGYYIEPSPEDWKRRTHRDWATRDRVAGFMTGEFGSEAGNGPDVPPDQFQLAPYTKEEGLAKALLEEADELTMDTDEFRGPFAGGDPARVAEMLLDLEYQHEYYMDLPGGNRYWLVPAETSFDQRVAGENINLYYKLLKLDSVGGGWIPIEDVWGDIFSSAVERIGAVFVERPQGNLKYAEEDAGYVLPGGEEQHELLFQVPSYEYAGHWDEEDIIMHARFNTRYVPNGRPEVGAPTGTIGKDKILFVEEIQSDLHQEGRKRGYKKDVTNQIIAQRQQLREILRDNDWLGYDGDADLIGVLETEAEGRSPMNPEHHQGDDYLYDWQLNSVEEAKKASQILNELMKLNTTRNSRGVPAAPFQKTETWSMVIMKRLIRWAVDNDYDAIAWTTGDRQNERWGLEKQFHEIHYEIPRYHDRPHLRAYANQRFNNIERAVTPDELERYVGRELAEKIKAKAREQEELADSYEIIQIKDTGDDIQLDETWGSNFDPMYPSVALEDRWVIVDQNGEYVRAEGGAIMDFLSSDIAERHIYEQEIEDTVVLSGLDLRIGGEGMRGFYDKSMVNNTNKFVKKWGGKVIRFGQRIDVGETAVTGDMAMAARGIPSPKRQAYWDALSNQEKDNIRDAIEIPYTEPSHLLEVTPQMREAAAAGFPLFSLQEGQTQAQARKHARKLYDRIDWNVFDPSVDAGFIDQSMSKEEIQEAIEEYATMGVLSKYFRRWFGKSQATDSFGTPLTFFHGSPNNDIDRFRLEKSHRNFISVSTSAGFASQFSNYVDPEWGPSTYDFEGFEERGDRATVYPVFVKADKIFDFRNAKMRRSYSRWLRDRYIKKRKIPTDFKGREHGAVKDFLDREVDMVSEGDWATMEGKRMQDFLSERGYDAFYMIEGGVLNLGVFNPFNIKSATGNIGTFSNETSDTVFSLDPNEVGNELSRRLNLFQMRAHLQRTVKDTSTIKAIQKHIQDGIDRGLFDIRATNILSGKESSLKQILKKIDQSVKGGDPITNRTALSPVVARQAINDIMETWEAPIPAENIHVHADHDGLPPRIRGELRDMQKMAASLGQPEPIIEGFLDPQTNEIHIVAGNIGTIQSLHRVFTEEALGHYGLRTFFGSELDGFLDGVIPNLEGSPAWDALINGAYKHIGKMIQNPKTRQRGKRMAAEELLAKMEVDQSTWQKFVAWVRAWFRQHRMLTNYTEQDLRRIMTQVHQRVMNGTTPHPWGTRNHRSSPPYSLAYHGSLTEFDAFDEEYIGTGTATAYGHGFYVAEDKKVADFYAGALPSVRERQGQMYKVDIPDDAVKTMLDWDALIEDQPNEVKQAIEDNPWIQSKIHSWTQSFGELRGKHIYRLFAFMPSDGMSTNQPAASKTLAKYGVRGIRYLDAGSRGFRGGLISSLIDASKGKRNMVIFDSDDINIVSRNGIPYSIKTKGHIAGTQGGLRGHSAGEVYPLMVLGIGDPNTELKWAVQRPDGTISSQRFDTPAEAHTYAQEIAQGLSTVPFSLAQFPQYSESYPEAAEDDADVKAFMAARQQIRDEIKNKGFEPYFNPEERYDVDKEQYPVQITTVEETKPARKATISAIRKRVKTAGARRRLQDAYDIGVVQGGNDMWYQMGQLEDEFIREYGEERGREVFKERFIDAMAATTAQSQPEMNLLLATFMNYLSNRGELGGYIELPPDLLSGAAFTTKKNMYNQLVREKKGFKSTQPKSHDFAANFSGWEWMATIDSQMQEIMTPKLKKKKKIRNNMMFAYQELVIEMAAKNGVSPREFQEVAWGGYKYTKDGYLGKPMIQIVNEAIERTSRLTGAAPEEVVRKGIVRGEMPVFAIRDPEGREEELEIINSKIAKSRSEMTVLDRAAHWVRDLHKAIAAGDFIWGLKQGTLDDAAVIERYERELFGTLLDASQSPYKAMHTTKNLPSVMAAVSKVGIPVYQDGAFQPAQDGRKGFIEIFRPLYEHPDGDLLRLWEGYAAARRANELIQQTNRDGTKREKLFSQEEIDKLLAPAEQYPEFDVVYEDWRNFNNQLLDLAVQMGVIGETERDAWADNDYVPFYRAMEEIEGVDQRTGFGQIKAGVEGQSSGIRRLHGSEKMLGNIVENMWFNTASLVDKIYKNNAMNRVVDMLEGVAMKETPMPWQAIKLSNAQLASALRKAGLLSKNEDTALKQVKAMTAEQRNQWSTVFRQVRPTAPNVVGVMREGRMVWYEVEDEMLLSTLKGMGADGLHGLMKAMGFSKSLLTRMVTLDPAFMIANWMRDTLSAWVTSDANFTPVMDSIMAAGDVFRESGSYMQMMMSGSGGGGFYDLTGGDVSRVLREELSHGGRHWAHSAWIGYLKLGAASENSNRLAIANRILKKGGTVAEAMYQAQDIMNFTMSGDYMTTKFLIRTVPFLNARLQGLYRLYRGVKQHPLGFTIKGAAIMAATLALLAKNWDDDDYERLEEWQKDIQWNFYNENRFHWAIPKPFEVGVIFGTLPERAVRMLMGRDDLPVAGNALARMFGETFAMNPTPQLFKPILEQMMDYNFFMGSPIVGLGLSGLEPVGTHLQYNPWTSEAAKRIGGALPDWAGKARSPRRIEHLVRAYTGTMGLYTMNAVDWMIRQADSDMPEKPTRYWYERPVLKRFLKGDAETAPYNKYTQKVYDVLDESNSAQRAFNALAKQGRLEEAREVARENRVMVDPTGKATEGSPRKRLLKIQTALRDINTAQRAVMDSKTLTAEEKRKRLDQLQITRHTVLNNAAVLLERLDDLTEQ